MARIGPWGASQILWVSETRTSIAHANVSRLEFADECNEGQEAEAKARAKRRRYKTYTNSFNCFTNHFSLLFDEDLRKLCAFNILGNFSVFFSLFCYPLKLISLIHSLVPCCNIEFCCFCACKDLRNSFYTQIYLSTRPAASAERAERLENRNTRVFLHPHRHQRCHSGLKWKLIRKFNLQTNKKVNRILNSNLKSIDKILRESTTLEPQIPLCHFVLFNQAAILLFVFSDNLWVFPNICSYHHHILSKLHYLQKCVFFEKRFNHQRNKLLFAFFFAV